MVRELGSASGLSSGLSPGSGLGTCCLAWVHDPARTVVPGAQKVKIWVRVRVTLRVRVKVRVSVRVRVRYRVPNTRTTTCAMTCCKGQFVGTHRESWG